MNCLRKYFLATVSVVLVFVLGDVTVVDEIALVVWVYIAKTLIVVDGVIWVVGCNEDKSRSSCLTPDWVLEVDCVL